MRHTPLALLSAGVLLSLPLLGRSNALNGRCESSGVGGKGSARPVSVNIPLHTIENPDYAIPPGTYEVRMTWSPKFGRMMPEVMNVPATPDYPSADGRTTGFRTGIRLHKGTHSEGCLLMSEPEYSQLRNILQTYEKVTITIAPTDSL